ncbi:MAG: hypothetical protein WBQ44_07755 [Rhodococcus sp. (in: high G+C Gram-positive bacteria)]
MTDALWQDEQVIAGGSIRSGTLDIRVGPVGAEVNEFVLTSLGGNNLGPNRFSQAPLSVKNAGTTAMTYRLQSASQSGALPLTLRASRVNAVADCPAGAAPTNATSLYDGPLGSAQSSARPLASGASEVWCFRVTLGDNPPQNATSTVKLSFRADQA